MDLEEKEIEEGECSDDDEITGQYIPLARPVEVSKQTAHQKVDDDSDSDPPERPSDPDSDSDDDRPAAKKKFTPGPWRRRDAVAFDADESNDAFRKMAAAFQAERTAKKNASKKNNVWGSILQEDSLNTDLLGVGVGRSLKDLDSDRGAEAYDYRIVAEEREKERLLEEKKNKHRKKGGLDKEMEAYWKGGDDGQDMDEEEEPSHVKQADRLDDDSMDHKAINAQGDNSQSDERRRGLKRSVKDRLGQKRVKLDSYKNEKLPPPGVSKRLVDISEEDMVEGSDTDFGHLLADRLGEDKPELIVGVVSTVGRWMARQVYQLTQKTEAEGGMAINNGARRRTSGGVFLFLLKTDDTLGIDKGKVKKFLNDSRKQEERKILNAKKKMKQKHYEQELQEFIQLKKNIQRKETDDDSGMQDAEPEAAQSVSMSDSADNNSLVSLVANFCKGDSKETDSASNRLSKFQEPDAPPNSVERVEERVLQEYDDDDFLDAHVDTESLELF